MKAIALPLKIPTLGFWFSESVEVFNPHVQSKKGLSIERLTQNLTLMNPAKFHL